METTKKRFNGFYLLLILVLSVAHPFEENSDAQEITPPDVFSRVALVRNEIELIRRYMGKPKETRPEIEIADAAPREVYFQALTLFRKIDQLCFELTRQRAVMPPIPAAEIHPSHVLEVVQAGLECLQEIKKEMNITQTNVAPERDMNKTPSDVFRSVVQGNRQINLLLVREFSPSDVYQEVTTAINYAAFLLRRFPDIETRIPDAPPFESNKVPADVYRLLVKCFALIREISNLSGLTMLKWNDTEDTDKLVPSDVYDIASLLISELHYINQQAGNNPPPKSYFPGLRFPSHVFQRAGILKTQLMELLKQVKAQPNWLKK
ncbi:MAG: hypothetical protein ACE5G9_00920 [Nitrospinales bacterium]